MFGFPLPSGARPGISVGAMLLPLALVVGAVVWIATVAIEYRTSIRAEVEAVRAMWAGAELVRLCEGGREVYQLDGRLVTGLRGLSRPVVFAADVTAQAACAR